MTREARSPEDISFVVELLIISNELVDIMMWGG
jgi:hypothetical protein